MRHDAIEIGLVSKAARRREAKRMPQTSVAATAPATDALDEAFAGLSREEQPKSLAVVMQLAEQLQSLDRQREQLAKLLRDIETIR